MTATYQKLSSIALFSLCFLFATAQDTLLVNALTYDSTTRSVMVQFPEEGTFRKIELLYSMRCHDLAVGNGAVGCREWDYHCNTVITDPTTQDSLLRQHPSHTISNFIGTAFQYSNVPTYTYTQYTQKQTTVSNPADAMTTTLGLGNEQHTFTNPDATAKLYLLYTAEELTASHLKALPGEPLDPKAMVDPFTLLPVAAPAP